MIKRLTILTLLIAGIISQSYAQSFYAIRRDRSLILVIGTGTSTYFGELSNPGDYIDAKPNLNVGLQYFILPRVSARGEVTWFQLSGDDAKADDGSRQRRNLSFLANNFEASLTGAINLFPNGNRYYQRPVFNAYVFAGVGFIYSNPTAELNGTRYALQPLQTEGVKYSKFQPVIPYGLGIKLKMGPFFNVALEGGYRMTFTDYLDDASTVYPDPASFNDQIAAALSMRYAYTVPTGTQRGNPEANDGYFLINIKIEYYLPTNFLFRNSSQKLYRQKRRPSHR